MWTISVLLNVLTLLTLILAQECSVPVIESKFDFSQTPKNATTIDCKNQQVAELPSYAVANFTLVKQIDLSNNRIKTISANAFYNLPVLEELSLSFNDIETLKQGSLNGLKSLRTLKLERNLLRSIDSDTFKDLTELQLVDLSVNELASWDAEWFVNSKKLWKITAAENLINTLPQGAFRNNVNLNTIDFSSNQLVNIDKNAFKGLKTLGSLLLYNNKIEAFHPDTFAPFNGTLFVDRSDRRRVVTNMDRHMHATFSGIHELYIDHNRLSFLPAKMLRDLHKLTSINIHSNPWQCSCYRKMVEWITRSKQPKRVDIFKKTCLRLSNPVCVMPLGNSQECQERVDKDLVQYYFDNSRNVDDEPYNADDLYCF